MGLGLGCLSRLIEPLMWDRNAIGFCCLVVMRDIWGSSITGLSKAWVCKCVGTYAALVELGHARLAEVHKCCLDPSRHGGRAESVCIACVVL